MSQYFYVTVQAPALRMRVHLPCYLDKVAGVGGEVGALARGCHKIRDHFGLAEAVAVDGNRAEPVAKMRLEHKGNAVALGNQFHDGGKISGIQDIVILNTVFAEIVVHDLACTLLRLHKKNAFLFKQLQIKARIAVMGIGLGKATNGMIFFCDDQKLLFPETFIFKLRVQCRGLAVEGNLHTAVQQSAVVLIGVALKDVDPHIGVQLFKSRERVWQHIGTAHIGKGHVQGTDVALEDVRELYVEIVFLTYDFRGLSGVALARVGKQVFIPRTAKELQPQVVLQRNQEFAQGRLPHIECLRSFCDVLILGDRQHILSLFVPKIGKAGINSSIF